MRISYPTQRAFLSVKVLIFFDVLQLSGGIEETSAEGVEFLYIQVREHILFQVFSHNDDNKATQNNSLIESNEQRRLSC
jgi:hypothetical protein